MKLTHEKDPTIAQAHQLWVWYWDVKFRFEPLTEDMKPIYYYHEYMLKHQRFYKR